MHVTFKHLIFKLCFQILFFFLLFHSKEKNINFKNITNILEMDHSRRQIVKMVIFYYQVSFY